MHEYTIIETGQPLNEATKAMILLHGRGGSAQNILPLSDAFADDAFYIAAPQATNNTWYPYSFLAPESQNEPWLSSAVDIIKRLMDEIVTRIPFSNIYITGFSQGACLALEASARFASPFGGVIAFTGGLIGESIDPQKYSGHFDGARIFIGNSDRDPHVPLIRSEASARLLTGMGARVMHQVYPGKPHIITEQEIKDVQDFIFS